MLGEEHLSIPPTQSPRGPRVSLGDDVYHRKKEMENEGDLDYSCLSKKSGAFECCFRHYFKKEKKREISSMNFS